MTSVGIFAGTFDLSKGSIETLDKRVGCSESAILYNASDAEALFVLLDFDQFIIKLSVHRYD